MSVQTVTDALMTDSTGQQIVEAIQDLAASQSPEAKNVSQTAIPGVTNVDDALSHLKDEIESSQGGDVKTVNNIEPDENGDIHIDEIQFAKQLVTEDAQQSSGTYIERTTGGDASLSDGDAQLIAIFGRSVKSGYVAEVLNLTVDAVERIVPEGITATLDTETFIAYITPEEEQESGEEEEEVVSDLSGTYSTEYDGSDWSIDPEEMGLTVSGTPASGDSITVYYDGENDPSITMVYCPRYADPEITAVIDRDTFVAYVNVSGTITLTYDSGWSVAPSLYGVTVTGKPVDGDEITIGYVKEDRGVITHANPTAFKSTGWNLYNNTNGYARVLKYSELYGFIIGGTYTAVQFSETLSGEKTTITPVDGHFSVSSDGYVWVTGGNATDTYIVMEWSDWTDGPEGDFKAYSESVVDLSSAMANFPYGLMQVGSVYDEINLNMGYAYSRVNRLTYSAANLAYAKALGQTFDVDRNYIYVPKETADVYSISVDGSHTACDHGMEIITGTTVSVYVQTLYGNNLVDKLRNDVLTISQQTLTEAQKTRVCQNLGINRSTLRPISFAIAVSDWSSITGGFKATFLSSYITTTCDWEIHWDASYPNAKNNFLVDLKSGGGGLEFVTATKPTSTITGIIKVLDNDDGKLPVVFQGTVGSIENGYTGQNSMAGIRNAFGIGDLATLKTSAKSNLVAAVNEQNDHVEALGTMTSATGNITVPNSEWVTVCSLQLSKGKYIVIGSLRFQSNENGARFIILDTNPSANNNNSSNSVCPTGRADLQRTNYYSVSSSTTVYVRAYQTSGLSLTAEGLIQAIKVGN